MPDFLTSLSHIEYQCLLVGLLSGAALLAILQLALDGLWKVIVMVWQGSVERRRTVTFTREKTSAGHLTLEQADKILSANIPGYAPPQEDTTALAKAMKRATTRSGDRRGRKKKS